VTAAARPTKAVAPSASRAATPPAPRVQPPPRPSRKPARGGSAYVDAGSAEAKNVVADVKEKTESNHDEHLPTDAYTAQAVPSDAGGEVNEEKAADSSSQVGGGAATRSSTTSLGPSPVPLEVPKEPEEEPNRRSASPDALLAAAVKVERSSPLHDDTTPFEAGNAQKAHPTPSSSSDGGGGGSQARCKGFDGAPPPLRPKHAVRSKARPFVLTGVQARLQAKHGNTTVDDKAGTAKTQANEGDAEADAKPSAQAIGTSTVGSSTRGDAKGKAIGESSAIASKQRRSRTSSSSDPEAEGHSEGAQASSSSDPATVERLQRQVEQLKGQLFMHSRKRSRSPVWSDGGDRNRSDRQEEDRLPLKRRRAAAPPGRGEPTRDVQLKARDAPEPHSAHISGTGARSPADSKRVEESNQDPRDSLMGAARQRVAAATPAAEKRPTASADRRSPDASRWSKKARWSDDRSQNGGECDRADSQEQPWFADEKPCRARDVDERIEKRAMSEGVLAADLYKNELFVKVDGQYKKVPELYWCPLCDVALNTTVLAEHLDGSNHRTALSQHRAGSAAWSSSTGAAAAVRLPSPVQRAPSPSAASAAAAATSAVVASVPWVELDAATGGLKCVPCNKVMDSIHEQTPDHRRRVDRWEWEHQERDYPAPDQSWLAWIRDESYGKARYLKCLLCKKWVTDRGNSMDTRGYNGEHGEDGHENKNTREHAKNIRHLTDAQWAADIKKQRHEWHPPVPWRR